METELKNKWLTALRSEKYKQGTTYLRDGSDKYCCLGVLCDVVDPEKWVHNNPDVVYYQVDLDKDHPDYYDGVVHLDSALDEFLPQVGLTGQQQSHLIKMNDSDEKTFEEIADWIEENV